MIFGAFSNLFIGECYYLVPRLCGVRIPRGGWGVALAFVWNIALMAGLISLPLGENHGLEAGELPLFAEIPILFVTASATVQFLMTIGRRLEAPLYVALWYLIGAFVWTVHNLILGSFILPYTISGINSAAFHGLYIRDRAKDCCRLRLRSPRWLNIWPVASGIRARLPPGFTII